MVRAMLARLGEVFSRWAERWVPDPFVLALFLTLVTLVGGFSLTGSVGEVLQGWFSGFSSTPLLAFALQMCLILVTGQALASSPPVQKLVRALARGPKTTPAAAGLVALIACVTGLIQWGLGAVVAAFVVREIAANAAEEGRPMDVPVLGAAFDKHGVDDPVPGSGVGPEVVQHVVESRPPPQMRSRSRRILVRVIG